VLYLDQFFLSNAFKKRDVRFRSAAQLIEEKAKRQLLLTPYSSTHEDETYQWRGYAGKSRDDLMEFIKAASGGHEFKPKYKIETDQIAMEQQDQIVMHRDMFAKNLIFVL